MQSSSICRAIAATFLVLATTLSGNAAPFRVLETVPIGGDGGWDYLICDAATHRLFVTRGTHVQVVDLVSHKVVGDIPNTDGVHGVALAPRFNHGFTSNGKSDTVTMFDYRTLKVLASVKTGKKPDAIVYDPSSQRVFAMNGRGDSATAIDAASGQVVGTVELGGQPEYAAPDGDGHVFANLEDKSEVVEIDSHSLKLLGHWPLAPGESPSGMAADTRGHRLFIGCHNQKMVVFDTKSHTIVTSLPIGKKVDANTYDPATGLAFSSNGDGTLTVVATHPYKVLQNVETLPGARTMALDPLTHRVYLCTARVESAGGPGQRPKFVPGSFVILIVGN